MIDLRPFRKLGTAVLAVGLVGCTSAASQGVSSTPPSGSLNAPQGVDSTTISIGYSGVMSGPGALGGLALVSGVRAAVRHQNSAGGINGRKINLAALDDQFQAPKQVVNIRQLVTQNRVYGLVAIPGTALVPASWPFIQENGVPMFGPVLPPDPNIKNVFTLGSSLTDQTHIGVKYLVSKMKANHQTRLGAVFSDDQIGREIQSALHLALKGSSEIQLVSEQTVQGIDTNVTPIVLNAQAKNPDAMILGSTSAQAYLFIKTADGQGFHPTYLGTSSTINDPNIVSLPAAAGALSTSFTQLPYGPGTVLDTYRRDMASIGQAASVQSLQTYAITMVFFHILTLAGNDLSWDNFVKTAEHLSNYQTGMLPPITFGPLPNGHHGGTGALVQKITDGSWQPVTNFMEPPK